MEPGDTSMVLCLRVFVFVLVDWNHCNRTGSVLGTESAVSSMIPAKHEALSRHWLDVYNKCYRCGHVRGEFSFGLFAFYISCVRT